MIIIPYNFVYYISYQRSKEEILSKTDPNFTSDGMKAYIREFKRRQREGLVEDMQTIIQSGSKDIHVRADGTSDLEVTKISSNDDN